MRPLALLFTLAASTAACSPQDKAANSKVVDTYADLDCYGEDCQDTAPPSTEDTAPDSIRNQALLDQFKVCMGYDASEGIDPSLCPEGSDPADCADPVGANKAEMLAAIEVMMGGELVSVMHTSGPGGLGGGLAFSSGDTCSEFYEVVNDPDYFGFFLPPLPFDTLRCAAFAQYLYEDLNQETVQWVMNGILDAGYDPNVDPDGEGYNTRNFIYNNRFESLDGVRINGTEYWASDAYGIDHTVDGIVDLTSRIRDASIDEAFSQDDLDQSRDACEVYPTHVE